MQPLYIATEEEQEILRDFGILEYSKETTYFQLQEQVRSSPSETDVIWQKTSRELNQFVAKLQQVFGSLNIFSFRSLVVPNGLADLEVTFDGKVAINNVVDAKEQFIEWNLILEGYARALGCTKEDFAFVTISKASPTKLRIRTKLEYIGLVLTIITGLIEIEQRFIVKRSAIEQIKTSPTPLVDVDADAAYIRRAEEGHAEQAKQEVERLATKSLEQLEVTDHEARAFFTKGVDHQYQFIVNGGTVNVFLSSPTDPEPQRLLEDLHAEQAKLKQLEERLKIMQGKARKEIPEKSED